jgi:hypothetical protein
LQSFVFRSRWPVGFEIVARDFAVSELTHELGCDVALLPVDHPFSVASQSRWRKPELMAAMGRKQTLHPGAPLIIFSKLSGARRAYKITGVVLTLVLNVCHKVC